MVLPGVQKAVTLLPREGARKDLQGVPFGLGLSGVHEVTESGFGDMAGLTGFALAACRALPAGPFLWVSQWALAREHGYVQQRAVNAIQGQSRPCLFVRPRKLPDTLWTIEEGIRSGAVACVVAELADADFTATRRLVLASSRHGVPAILLMPYTREGATAATARWRVSARASSINRLDPRGLGKPRWRAVLERSRQVPHLAGQGFDVEYEDETLSFHLAAGLAARSPAPRPAAAVGETILRRTG